MTKKEYSERYNFNKSKDIGSCISAKKLLSAIEEFKKDFDLEDIDIESEIYHSYGEECSRIILHGFRKFTEHELDQDYKQWKNNQKILEEARECNDRREYERLKKKYDK